MGAMPRSGQGAAEPPSGSRGKLLTTGRCGQWPVERPAHCREPGARPCSCLPRAPAHQARRSARRRRKNAHRALPDSHMAGGKGIASRQLSPSAPLRPSVPFGSSSSVCARPCTLRLPRNDRSARCLRLARSSRTAPQRRRPSPLAEARRRAVPAAPWLSPAMLATPRIQSSPGETSLTYRLTRRAPFQQLV